VSGSLSNALFDRFFAPAIGGTYSTVTNMIQRSDGKILVSGGFRVIGGKRRNLIALLNNDGTVDNSFDVGKGVSFFNDNGSIEAIAPQSDNKTIISGTFDQVNGLPRRNLARLNPDGTVDPSFDTGSGLDSQAQTIKVWPNGKILIGGYFDTFNSQPIGSFIRLNSDGTRDLSFTGVVNAFVVPDFAIQPGGRIIVGGGIVNINGTQRRGIARLNENGKLDATMEQMSRDS
jgi:uncharacterized delta-60 repeat protein